MSRLDPDADTEAELVQCGDIYSVQENTRLAGYPDRQRSKPKYQSNSGKQFHRAKTKYKETDKVQKTERQTHRKRKDEAHNSKKLKKIMKMKMKNNEIIIITIKISTVTLNGTFGMLFTALDNLFFIFMWMKVIF